MTRYFHTLLHRKCTILHPSQCMRCACFPTALIFGNFGVNYSIFCLSLLFFPPQTENIQVTLTEERRSEGNVGFKAYKNYFIAGTHWLIIIFLILLNIMAQVNKNICFILCH